MENKHYMNYNKALLLCKELSKSTGFYCRKLEELENFTEYDKMAFNQKMIDNNIKEDLDLIFYFEC